MRMMCWHWIKIWQNWPMGFTCYSICTQAILDDTPFPFIYTASLNIPRWQSEWIRKARPERIWDDEQQGLTCVVFIQSLRICPLRRQVLPWLIKRPVHKIQPIMTWKNKWHLFRWNRSYWVIVTLELITSQFYIYSFKNMEYWLYDHHPDWHV